MKHLSSVCHVYIKVSEENVVVLSRWGPLTYSSPPPLDVQLVHRRV